MLLRGLDGWHLVIIIGLLTVLFGARKLPDAARSLGQSLRIFKSETRAAREDEPPTPTNPAERAAPQAVEAAPDASAEAHRAAKPYQEREHAQV